MSDNVILGIGIDLVENSRVQSMLDRWGGKFTEKVFLPKERSYCESMAVPCRNYAGRFAVKEAVSKAFSTGISSHLSWLDMEVVKNTGTGAPSVKFSGKAAQYVKSRGVSNVMISLSHTHTYSIAEALLVGEAGHGE